VFGLVAGGAYAEYAVLDEVLAIAKPDEMSWVEAASLPEAWMTAWLNLVQVGQVKAGDNVLIHAGASGVGACAIQLAAAGCTPVCQCRQRGQAAILPRHGGGAGLQLQGTPAFRVW
jgi:NADPH2:quinone reductase